MNLFREGTSKAQHVKFKGYSMSALFLIFLTHISLMLGTYQLTDLILCDFSDLTQTRVGSIFCALTTFKQTCETTSVMDISPRLTGDEWQNWANLLLQRHYGFTEYQKVPDNYKGDAGIEGFTITSGCAYQVYGPEEPLTTEQRFKKHQKKMTDDLRKFINNHVILSTIFGRTKIRRWVLLVPFFDSKQIVQHATKKTEEIIAANLPYVDNNDFRVVIVGEEAFACERDQLLKTNMEVVSIVPDEIPPQAIFDWGQEHDTLVLTLDDKSSRIPTLINDHMRHSFRNRMIQHFLEGQNLLGELRKYPTVYENIRMAKSECERYLATEVLLATGSPISILENSLEKIRQVVKAEVSGVSNYTIEAVAREAVSDWLIRCPLDFPERVPHG
jgi:hypothetical protein